MDQTKFNPDFIKDQLNLYELQLYDEQIDDSNGKRWVSACVRHYRAALLEIASLQTALDQAYDILSRQAAEPGADTGALIEAMTVIEKGRG